MNCGIIGFMAGVACYSTVKNGFGFLTFLPVIFFPIGAKTSKEYKAVKQELVLRNSINQN